MYSIVKIQTALVKGRFPFRASAVRFQTGIVLPSIMAMQGFLCSARNIRDPAFQAVIFVLNCPDAGNDSGRSSLKLPHRVVALCPFLWNSRQCFHSSGSIIIPINLYMSAFIAASCGFLADKHKHPACHRAAGATCCNEEQNRSSVAGVVARSSVACLSAVRGM